MKSKIFTYDVGTNFDYRLFDIIKEYDKDHMIKTLYGKIRNDGLPGGRASSIIPDFTMEQLEDYVKVCRENGLSFNYLINPLCMDQNENDPVMGKKIRNFIHETYDIGIREFTLNSPELIKYVKKSFNDVRITLGLYAYPSNIQHIQYWADWGVDEITLDHSFNRNFALLRHVLEVYKESSISMRLIANNFCFKDCPFKLAHGCVASHSGNNGILMDYYLINCAFRKVTNPRSMLTSEWIRPEDVHIYEELVESTGFKHFSLKLVDRTRSTGFIERVIKAYLSQSYNGNLLDIINWPETKNMSIGKKTAISPAAGRPRVKNEDMIKPEVLIQYGDVMRFPEIFIDNTKLNGFVEHFYKNNHCSDCLCSDNILPHGQSSSASCGYCSSWYDKAIHFDKDEIDRWLSNASELLNSLEDCSIYK
ncbi:MAG: hypothetical protein Q4F95_14380 [Oscillospiraceae bacterium]|nr:hypothetical protein [Oscillospiraceae bacterium]